MRHNTRARFFETQGIFVNNTFFKFNIDGHWPHTTCPSKYKVWNWNFEIPANCRSREILWRKLCEILWRKPIHSKPTQLIQFDVLVSEPQLSWENWTKWYIPNSMHSPRCDFWRNFTRVIFLQKIHIIQFVLINLIYQKHLLHMTTEIWPCADRSGQTFCSSEQAVLYIHDNILQLWVSDAGWYRVIQWHMHIMAQCWSTETRPLSAET